MIGKFINLTAEDKVVVLLQALRKASKVIRTYPPTEMEFFLQDARLMSTLAGGKERDPEGAEYSLYFIEKTMEERENDIRKTSD